MYIGLCLNRNVIIIAENIRIRLTVLEPGPRHADNFKIKMLSSKTKSFTKYRVRQKYYSVSAG